MYTLDTKDKTYITLWAVSIALLLGSIEAIAFASVDQSQIDLPLYWVMGMFTVVVILSIIPWTTQERSDWYLVIGGVFLVQWIQDIGHWVGRAMILGSWKIGDPLWTPLWDVLNVDFPIPLFWIIDIVVFGIMFWIWME
ncbi:hypothetical protein KAR91_47570 [Candidatus Pacearchaeota archaeon]|nr:hypothetical protein [Candidatus Pacearchaeota archaeon]